MQPEIHQGACLCGAVTFEAEGPLRPVIVCHCGQCRKSSGHIWAATSVPHDRFRLIRDKDLVWYRSSDTAQRGHCGKCGSSLFWQPEGEARISIAPGALDDSAGLQPGEHIFTDDSGDYVSGGTARHGVPAQPLHGSCLCGGCTFTLPGPAGEITACHCHQCRRLSGYYSASFDVAAMDWQRQDSLATFTSPNGDTRGFCRQCGSQLYFRAQDGALSVEAGVIDGATGARLVAHIFTADRGSYYALDDGLPQFPGWET